MKQQRITSEKLRVIHSIIGIEYKNCSATWKEVKKKIKVDEESFISELKKELNLV